MRIFWPTWSEFGSTSGLSACSCSTLVPWSAAIVSKVSPSRIVYVRFTRGRGRVVPRSVVVRSERVAGGGGGGGRSSFGSSPDRTSKIATVAAARNAAGASNRGPQCVSRRRRRARGTGLPARGRRARGGSPVGIRVARRVRDGARDGDDRAGRTARERTCDVRRRRSLGAYPGQEQDRAGQDAARVADRARVRRADDGADARETAFADEVLAPLADEPRDVLPEQLAVAQDEVLDVGATLVRRLDEAEDARSLAPAGGQERLQRVTAEVRVDGERVRESAHAGSWLQIGRDVGARGRADVAALAVGNHEQARGACVGADLLERPHAVRPERLEERELRLDRDRVRRDGVHDPAAEAADRGGRRVAAELDRKQVEARVEPDDELAPLALDRFREAVAEGGDGGCRGGFEVLRHLR